MAEATKEGTPPAVDGRRLRSERNRQRIVTAMMDLVREGDYAPGAEAVADRAGVGLRSVFRHFNDMESLYREISETINREVRPLIEEPFASREWRKQLAELISRKIQLFEKMMMFYVAGKVHRQDSVFIRADHQHSLAVERKALRAVLPEEWRQRREIFEALDLVLSFDSWVRLRQDQKLSVRRGREVVETLVNGMLAG